MQNNPFQNLSCQEQKILGLIAQGYKSKHIADTLFICKSTVKNHKTNLCRKLNLSNTIELYTFALSNATLLQNGGGKFRIGIIPIFGLAA